MGAAVTKNKVPHTITSTNAPSSNDITLWHINNQPLLNGGEGKIIFCHPLPTTLPSMLSPAPGGRDDRRSDISNNTYGKNYSRGKVPANVLQLPVECGSEPIQTKRLESAGIPPTRRASIGTPPIFPLAATARGARLPHHRFIHQVVNCQIGWFLTCQWT